MESYCPIRKESCTLVAEELRIDLKRKTLLSACSLQIKNKSDRWRIKKHKKARQKFLLIIQNNHACILFGMIEWWTDRPSNFNGVEASHRASYYPVLCKREHAIHRQLWVPQIHSHFSAVKCPLCCRNKCVLMKMKAKEQKSVRL